MTTTLDLREVKAFWDRLADGLSTDEVFRALAERFPSLTVGDLEKVAELTWMEAERLQAEAARNKFIGEVLQRHMRSGDELIFDVLRRGANAGDPEAAAILREWEAELASPVHRAFNRVFEAAVDAHPDWARIEPGHFDCPPPDHPEGDEHKLVAWFERLYPAEAARITAEALAN